MGVAIFVAWVRFRNRIAKLDKKFYTFLANVFEPGKPLVSLH
jgi:hypothetical protein